MRAFPLLYSSLLLVSALGGCLGWSGCARSQVPMQEAEVPADFTMVFGQGGGFAGLWSGYVIHADGTVQTWQGPVTREDTTTAGMLPSEDIAALWNEVQENNYFDQDAQEAGNMTSFIELTANGTTHRTSWVIRVEKATPATPLERLYDYSRMLAQSVSDPNPPLR